MATSKSTISKSKTNKGSVVKDQPFFLFEKRNYYLMIAGLVLVVLGFLCMTGAKVIDPNVFDRSEIYSFRRITLAPILIIGGFVVEVFAIMLKPKGKVE
ncbi:MAG TPA: DUF3098 domain-containing protein [Edaphocola sp.]|nr:DUF3098 domain-containing protein [Edaphocola sp.]